MNKFFILNRWTGVFRYCDSLNTVFYLVSWCRFNMGFPCKCFYVYDRTCNRAYIVMDDLWHPFGARLHCINERVNTQSNTVYYANNYTIE